MCISGIPNITSEFDASVPGTSGAWAEQHENPTDFVGPDDHQPPREGIPADVSTAPESITHTTPDNFIKQYEHTLSEGTPSDQINLADTLLADQTSQDNLEKALGLYEQAAQHRLDAMHKAGKLLMNNPDLSQLGHEAALQYWRAAAERGYTPSIRGLGLAYRDGHGVPQNDLIAIEFLSRAYDEG